LDLANVYQLEEVDKILSMNNNFSQVIKLISGIFYLDIPLLNYMQLIDAGIPLEQIHVSNIDTYSDPQRFFSYQREAITGRHVSLIMLQ
jgi:copper oxidase (laccase) domain-containing protein